MPFQTKVSLRGNYHGFRNVGSAVGKMMFMATPGGLDEYFAEITNLQMPQDLDRLQEISRHYGYVFLDSGA